MRGVSFDSIYEVLSESLWKVQGQELPNGTKRRRSTVDEPVIHGTSAVSRKEAAHISKTIRFNSFVVAAIFLDTVLVGLALDLSKGEGSMEDQVFFILETLLCLFFIGELCTRFHFLGYDFFLDAWNVFDYTVVILSSVLVMSPLMAGEEAWPGLKVLRILRLLRVKRFIKGVNLFQGLWMVIVGFLDSVKTMLWLLVLLIVMVYCAACAIRTLTACEGSCEGSSLTPGLQEEWREADMYIGSVFRSMWTVWQVVTLDSWISDIGRPLYKVSPESFWILVAIVVTGTFGALSVIVAVMVENMKRSMESVHAETDKKLRASEGKMMESMLEDFARCDSSKDGELDFEEFQKLVYSASFRYKLRLLGLRPEEAESLFSIMDADDSGSVTPEEFIGGLHKLKGDANGIDITQLITFASRITQQASTMTKRVHVLSCRVDEAQAAMDEIGRGMTKELWDRNKADHRYDALLDEAAVRKRVIKHVQDRVTDFPTVVNLPKPVGLPPFVPCKETEPLPEMPPGLSAHLAASRGQPPGHPDPPVAPPALLH